MTVYAPYYDETGSVAGVIRDSTTYILRSLVNKDWQAFLEWNKEQKEPLSLESIIPVIEPPDAQQKALEAAKIVVQGKDIETLDLVELRSLVRLIAAGQGLIGLDNTIKIPSSVSIDSVIVK